MCTTGIRQREGASGGRNTALPPVLAQRLRQPARCSAVCYDAMRPRLIAWKPFWNGAERRPEKPVSLLLANLRANRGWLDEASIVVIETRIRVRPSSFGGSK
jgi:hypothetical protein